MPEFRITSAGDTAEGIGTPDVATGIYHGTLRQAINFANREAASPATITTITVDTSLAGQAVRLARDLPVLVSSAVIAGNGLVIDGGGVHRGLVVAGIASNGEGASATTVTLSALTIRDTLARGGDGGAAQNGGGGGGMGAGGALFIGPAASVTLIDVAFSRNRAEGGNGGALGTAEAGGGAGGGGMGGDGRNGGGGLLFAGGSHTRDADTGFDLGYGGGGGTIGAGQTPANGTGGAGGAGPVGFGGGGGGSGSSGLGGGAGGSGAGPGTETLGGAGGFGGGGGGGIIGGGGGFGGGGGGGVNQGGDGGYGGGGGSAGGLGDPAVQAGSGGFGGGGAGSIDAGAGSGGFGAGAGRGASGGGGAGLGGAVFVAAGGKLTVQGTFAQAGGSTAGGLGGTGAANGQAIAGGIFFQGAASGVSTLAFGAGDQSLAGAITDLAGAGGSGGIMGLAKTGAGTLTLSGANTYTGATLVQAGTLAVDGSLSPASAVSVKAGATLAGKGVLGALTVEKDATLSPGNAVGAVATGSLALSAGAVLRADIGGATAGSYDQANVTGTLSLSGAVLDLRRAGTFTASLGQSFLLLVNDGTDAIAGTFAGIAENTILDAAGTSFRVSYKGGTGNDLSLTAVTPAPSLSGVAASLATAENAAPARFAPEVTLASRSLAGGKITVSGLLAEDRVTLAQDAVVSLSGSAIVIGGKAVGTFAGGAGSEFVVKLINATPADAETLIEHLTYSAATESPAPARTLSLTVTDGAGAASPARAIAVSVAPNNDAPVFTGPAASFTHGSEDLPYLLRLADLLAGFADPDGDALSVSSLRADRGTIAIASNSNFTLTPEAGYSGPVKLSYRVDDGSAGADGAARISFDPVNDAPAFAGSVPPLRGREDTALNLAASTLLAGFTDPDGDMLRIVDLKADHAVLKPAGMGAFSLAPEADYDGAITLAFGVSDGKATVAATRTLVLDAVNDAPLRTGTPPVLAAGKEDTRYVLKAAALLAGFTDPDGDALRVIGLKADHGVVVSGSGGTFTLKPQPNYSGPVALTYRVSDGSADTTTTRSLVLKPVNDAPSALAGKLAVKENAARDSKAGVLKATDIDSKAIAFRLLDDAGGRFTLSGAKVLVADGVLLDYEQARSHTIRVEASDGAGGKLVMTLKVTVGDVAAETVKGGARADTIFGGKGADRLDGGAGNDTLRGGAGADVFVFSIKPGSANRDRIADFSSRDDTIALDDAVFAVASVKGRLAPAQFKTLGLKGAVLDADDRILFDPKAHLVSYDADGSGTRKAVPFAEIGTNTLLTAADFIVV